MPLEEKYNMSKKTTILIIVLSLLFSFYGNGLFAAEPTDTTGKNPQNSSIDRNNQMMIAFVQRMKSGNVAEAKKIAKEQKKNEDISRINNSYRKTYHNNINETKKLKDELKNLELMEEECIQKLQDYIKKNNDENIRFNNYQKIKFGNDVDNKIRRKANSDKRRKQNISANNLSRNKKDNTRSLPKLYYE